MTDPAPIPSLPGQPKSMAELKPYFDALPEFVARTSRVAKDPSLRENEDMWETREQENRRKFREWNESGPKLTKEQAQEILDGGDSTEEAARKFGIHRVHVWRIRSGKKWKSLSKQRPEDRSSK